MPKLRASFSRNQYGKRGFVLSIRLNKGAGYIGGREAFLAFNSGRKQHRDDHMGGALHANKRWVWEHIQVGSLELGMTQNAQFPPYAKHY